MSSAQAEAETSTNSSMSPKRTIRSRILNYLKSCIVPVIITLVFVIFAVLAATLYSGLVVKHKEPRCDCGPCQCEEAWNKSEAPTPLALLQDGRGEVLCVGVFITKDLLTLPKYCVLKTSRMSIVEWSRNNSNKFFSFKPSRFKKEEKCMTDLTVIEAIPMKPFLDESVSVPHLEHETFEPYRSVQVFGWVENNDEPMRLEIVLFSEKNCKKYFQVNLPQIPEVYCTLDMLPKSFRGVVLGRKGIIGLWMGCNSKDICIVRGLSQCQKILVREKNRSAQKFFKAELTIP